MSGPKTWLQIKVPCDYRRGRDECLHAEHPDEALELRDHKCPCRPLLCPIWQKQKEAK